MYKSGINARMLVNGRPVKEYRHGCATFIESRHGTQYTIKIGNDNPFRVMAIVSVDGLDVITGKPAEDVDVGYVIDSYSSSEIKGYRISDTESAAFTFSAKRKSYAAKSDTGDVRNAGVIGVRVVREKESPKPVQIHWKSTAVPQPEPIIWRNPKTPIPHPYSPTWVQYSDDIAATGSPINCFMSGTSGHSKLLPSNVCRSFDTDQLTTPQFDTGTAWGEQQTDKVKKVQFSRGSHLTDIVLYYASQRALEKMGIDLSDTPAVTSEDGMPKPFGKTQYCTPPKGWKSKK